MDLTMLVFDRDKPVLIDQLTRISLPPSCDYPIDTWLYKRNTNTVYRCHMSGWVGVFRKDLPAEYKAALLLLGVHCD